MLELVYMANFFKGHRPYIMHVACVILYFFHFTPGDEPLSHSTKVNEPAVRFPLCKTIQIPFTRMQFRRTTETNGREPRTYTSWNMYQTELDFLWELDNTVPLANHHNIGTDYCTLQTPIVTFIPIYVFLEI